MKEEKKPGLYEQLKNSKLEPIKYTKEHLIELFKDIFNRPVDSDKKVNLPLEWKHYEWEKDGKKYSMWKYTNGLQTLITTGDGGKAEFDRLIEEQFKETPKIYK